MNKTKIIAIGVFVSIVLYLIFKKSKKPKVVNLVGKLMTNGSWGFRDLGKVTDITVHHAASSNNSTAYDFAKYHVQSKGWKGIGYHRVIDRDGTINITNDLEALSWHNGFNNTNSIGICLVGNMENEPMTDAQKNSLIWEINRLKKGGQLPNLKNLVGHKEYPGANTACPGRYTNMDYLRKQTNLNPYPYTSAFMNQALRYDPKEADN